MSEGAFEGLRILDLTSNIAGPYCTKLFASYGAEVIKVENPVDGDPSRRHGPFPGDVPDLERSGLFLYLNAGKRDITLNLHTSEGAQILRRLVKDADIVVEDMPAGTLERLKLGLKTLKQSNPSLVVTSITSFGQTGPYRDYCTTELVSQALGGVLYRNGEPDMEPIRVGADIGQYTTGILSFIGTVAARFLAQETGEGRHVDMSIMECTSFLLSLNVMTYAFSGIGNQREGNSFGGMLGIVECKDGYLDAAINEEHQWQRLRDWTGIPELREPRFQTAQGRNENCEELLRLLKPWFAQWSKLELYRTAQEEYRLPFGYCATVEDLVNSRHLRSRGYFQDMDHPLAGRLTYPGAPFQMSKTPAQASSPAPLLGQHNTEVYSQILGFTKSDIVQLHQLGVI